MIADEKRADFLHRSVKVGVLSIIFLKIFVYMHTHIQVNFQILKPAEYNYNIKHKKSTKEAVVQKYSIKLLF